jgi:hypothetical protein
VSESVSECLSSSPGDDAEDTREKLATSLHRATAALRATAYHEAGHAVVAFLRGIRTGEVSIVPNYGEGTGGHVLDLPKPGWFNPEWDASARVVERLEGEIVCSHGSGAPAAGHGLPDAAG